MSSKTEQVRTVEFKARLNQYKWKVADILITTEDIDEVPKGSFIVISKRNRGYSFHTISEAIRITLTGVFGCEKFRKPTMKDWENVFGDYDRAPINETTDILEEIPF